jgi:hypothetical protein
MSGGRVFLSYRRDDTAGYAGRLYDRLNARFTGRIFMDVVGLEPGMDFVSEIERAVGSCQVLIALIGKQWLSVADSAGRRRLDRSDDFVRLEIATALRRRICVIPVLVGDALCPASECLPKDLVLLSRRQALKIRDTDFDYDAERLIRSLRRELGEREKNRSGQELPHPFSTDFLHKTALPFLFGGNRRMAWMAGLGVLLVAGGLQFLPGDGLHSPPESASAGTDAMPRKSVEIRLHDGGHAQVYRDGKWIGETPFTLPAHFGERVNLLLKRPGFKDTQQTLWIAETPSYLVPMAPEQ